MKDIEVGKGRVLQVKWGWSWDAEGNLLSVQLTDEVCCPPSAERSVLRRGVIGMCALPLVRYH